MSGQFDVLSLAVLLGGLSLMPLLVVCTTSFLKISLVLLVLRNAIGVQQVPPTLAIYGIALALSAFVMAPTVQQVGQRIVALDSSAPGAGGPRAGSAPLLAHAGEVFEPLRTFMLKYSRPEQRELFLASARKLWPAEAAREARANDTMIVIPAFVVSELQTGYEVGFLIYIPFVVIDLLISNLLMALGMQQVSPQTISIPLKLLLFVMVDGWGNLLNALALSYV